MPESEGRQRLGNGIIVNWEFGRKATFRQDLPGPIQLARIISQSTIHKNYKFQFSMNVLGLRYKMRTPGVGVTRLLPQSFSLTMPVVRISSSEYLIF
jgi:hypothetical protein